MHYLGRLQQKHPQSYHYCWFQHQSFGYINSSLKSCYQPMFNSITRCDNSSDEAKSCIDSFFKTNVVYIITFKILNSLTDRYSPIISINIDLDIVFVNYKNHK